MEELANQKILIPELGGADAVEVIEISVAVGDQIDKDQSIIVVESDKASMDIPSPEEGEVVSISVAEGDEVKEGDVILELSASSESKEVLPSYKSEISDNKDDPVDYEIASAPPETNSEIVLVPDLGGADKVELIENLEDGNITFCDHADFTDLCRGGHIPNTGFIKAVKLLSVAGAYWRGDETKPQLTRIYGISFPKQKELTTYLELLEEARKRDHRKLGKELDLFTFSQKVGQGLPLWLPKGAALRERLENFLKAAQKKAGYEQVISPHIGNKELYMTSGHFEKYGSDSFQPIETPAEGESFLLKPMNCPHHCEIFNARQWSYKDLPKRYAEFGTVYRYEQSGELHGLTRVRGFTQDDAHIFCMPSQLDEEFKRVIDLVLYVFSSLGFEEFTAQVSLRDPKKPEK